MKDIAIFPPGYHPDDTPGISILDVKEVRFDDVDSLEFSGISGLAYDEDKGLYALSDRGNLFLLDLEIKNKKIKHLEIVSAMVLKNKKNRPLKHNDSEGMAWNEEGLVISFERDPKVSLFNFKAQKLHNFSLPPVLKDIKNYQKKNRALESVLIHPEFGLITSPEGALKHEDKKLHTVYALDQRWKFKAHAKITSMELMPDNTLLVLERDFKFLQGHHIILSRLDLNRCKQGLCATNVLASLKSKEGWVLDNFEGLTRIKDKLYLMISDDNSSIFQKCIVVLFEIKHDKM